MSVYCKLCGKEYTSLSDLVNGFCENHPNGPYSGGKHQPL